MKLAAAFGLALFVVVTASIAAVASDGAAPVHHHRIHQHHKHLREAVHEPYSPPATAFFPPFAVASPAHRAKTADDCYDGLSRNPDCCNYGCIDNGRGR
jgi:hypothetical protein